MKTTIFLLALYGIFGFFACKQESNSLKPAARQVLAEQAQQARNASGEKPSLITSLPCQKNKALVK